MFFEEVNQWAGELGLEPPNPPPRGNWAAVPFWLMQDRDVNLSFLEMEDKSDIQIEVGAYLRGELETLLVIFTDGSKDPGSGRVGFGVYVAQLDLRMGLRISDGSCVFRRCLLSFGLCGGLRMSNQSGCSFARTRRLLWWL